MPDIRPPADVCVIDDHEIIRTGLRHLVTGADGMRFVGAASTAAEGLVLVSSCTPDVLILDLVLPDRDGISLAREVRSISPDTAVVLFTAFPDEEAMLGAALSGAVAYLLKDTSNDDILRVIRQAATGQLAPRSVASSARVIASRSLQEDPRQRLTTQERRVLELLTDGLTNRQIGERLNLSEKTVKNYVARILPKLDVGRRSEAAALSARLTERSRQRTVRWRRHATSSSGRG